ncbi:LADA_0B01618g1_1 [Lachancea dasiensis]|uniref:LADA_0B01618g1_1 n=1 Tax=Lachancea dasiensis TaxID=1072105 RepID=A0A1G4IRT2_9SACH|nr:LADA_0B01618g1_1 [Lachancea dasiensis]
MTRPHRSRTSRTLNSSSQEEPDAEYRDENGIIHTTTRSLRKVNYAEVENNYDFMDDDEEEDKDSDVRMAGKRHHSKVETDFEEGFDHDIKGEDHPKEEAAENADLTTAPLEEYPAIDLPIHNKSKNSSNGDEDESFHDEDDAEAPEDDEDDGSAEEYYSEESIKRNRRRADRNFIVSDEDDDDENGDEGQIHRTRNRSHRSSRNLSNVDTDDDEQLRTGRNFRSSTIRARRRQYEEDSPPRKLRRRGRGEFSGDDELSRAERLTLADELRELRDDSPIREKRSLRERTKPVNYTLPPPLPDNTVDDYTRMTSVNNPLSYPSPRGRRKLPSGQSFGPLRRLFPTGGPFGGNDVTAIFGTNTNYYDTTTSHANGSKLLLDSDSSEDEILPLGASPTQNKKQNVKKKKSEIADLDPLGVDMNVKFEDVGGLDNYIDQLKEMVALPLLYPELYQKFGITPPRGVLFHGPPGTGKTLMARALAASCSTEQQKITFFMRKGADILSKWVGEAERQLRLLFEEAKKHQPAIIFFDEIDGLAPVRSSKQEQIHASIVSTMLALMDGMDNRGQVIIIGATNRPDAVDPALRRPGRFDREFFFPLPDMTARSKILRIHTKKWDPPLPQHFIDKLASLTKGYGGADLRALCTEAALLSIQRKLPQIYHSDTKLIVDPSTVNVRARDFMAAIEKIIPSSARAMGKSAQPLPETVSFLLDEQLDDIKKKLKEVLPSNPSMQGKNNSIIKHYMEYEEEESDDNEDGFLKAEFLRNVEKARTCKPRLVVTGIRGNGQQYIGAAILHSLEDINIQMLDIANLVSESTRSIEAAVVQVFSEARRRQPSVLYIPNIDIWVQTVPENAILTLASLLGSLSSDEKVLLLAIASDLEERDFSEGILSPLDFSKTVCKIRKPSAPQRMRYFSTLTELIRMKPTSFKSERKRTKQLPPLPKATTVTSSDDLDHEGKPLTNEEKLIRSLKAHQAHDMKLKNTLKIKLSGLMDLFKNRYKRFRKPPIDDAALVHLFEPNIGLQGNPDYQPAYVKEDNMILECLTGRKYYNMDLDIVEERLWNGFYSEPRQFLKDIELIYRDAHVSCDRDRIIKASEMFVNAQMGIEEISQPEFVKECKTARQRELTRQQLYLEMKSRDDAKRSALEKEDASRDSGGVENCPKDNETDRQPSIDDIHKASDVPFAPAEFDTHKSGDIEPLEMVNVGSGSQLQCQALIDHNGTDITENANSRAKTADEMSSEDKYSTSTDKESSLNILPATGDQEKSIAKTSVAADASDSAESPGDLCERTAKENNNPTPPLILNDARLQEVLKDLGAATNECTTEQLQERYSSLLNIIWEERLSWDKSLAVRRMEEEVHNS